MKLWRHWRKKGQTGQSLIILAVGFLALLGFVGIVTDVSVLFVRYSTMRRAIDAAAIAAAGQMRRVVDETPTDNIADGEATSIANLNLAARQFIEVYGLDPKNVIVETCRSQEVAYNYVVDAGGNPVAKEAIDSNGVPLLLPNGDANPAAIPSEVAKYQELCTKDELKLVRVTAQINSPTIFLSLLGYPTITLTESAISQTAVIDVVLIFDVSESMLNETTYDDWDHVPNMTTANPTDEVKLGVRYVPPLLIRDDVYDHVQDPTDPASLPSYQNPWGKINSNTQHTLNNWTLRTLVTPDPSFRDKTIAFEPDTTDPSGFRTVTMPIGGTTPQGRQEPREFCQVRAFVPTVWFKSPVEPDLYSEYSAYFSGVGGNVNNEVAYFQGAPYFMGFVPMYNYYGCCNDPDGLLDANGNMDFSDLVCQPFQKARNAADSFLSQLDFLRGDRVALVTFDRVANPIDPDGNGPQATMIETEHNLADPSDPTGNTLLRKGAVETLHSVVGVRAEYSNYADTNHDGLWDALVDGVGGISTTRTYDNLLNGVAVGDLVSNPVAGACPYDKATLDPQWLEAAGQWHPDGSPRGNALLDDIVTTPDWALAGSPSIAEVSVSTATNSAPPALAPTSAALWRRAARPSTPKGGARVRSGSWCC